MNKLYIVATPIGNLEDVTIRAIKILLTVPVVACEDTRRTGLLIKLLAERYGGMTCLGISARSKRYISIRDWNESEVLLRVLRELGDGDVALVSDAGTPLISDPGYKLVRAARQAGFPVVPIPGVSALTAALSAAGLPTNKFMFWGFMSKKWRLLPGMTHIIYESPKRTEKTLAQIIERYPNSEIVVANELTKIHEKFQTIKGDSVTDLKNLKGEVTILVYVPDE